MTVLVAEDDPVIRRFCYRSLRQAGYQVLEAENGEVALQLIESQDDVDLIVTDLTMPRLGGREIAEVLSVFRPGLPVLGMSSSAYKLDPDRRLPVLAKPFSAATLLAAVEEMRLRAISAGSWTEEKRARAQELGRIAATVQLRGSTPPEKVDLIHFFSRQLIVAGLVQARTAGCRIPRMNFSLTDALPVLRSTPRVVRAWLWDLPQSWTQRNEGPGTWSPYDVVGHLIHGERTDWIPRLELLLEHGESRPFTPFDRFAQFRDSQGKTLHQLLDTFAELRTGNLTRLESLALQPPDYRRPGMHPELGPVTLGQLLASWVVHDLNHVSQIARAMGSQYGEAVGPWLEYLPLLQRGPS